MKKISALFICVVALTLMPAVSFSAGTEELILVHSSGGRLSPSMSEWTFNLYGKEGSEPGFKEMALTIEDEDGHTVYSSPLMEIEGDLYRAHVLLADANFDGHMDVLFTEGPLGTHRNCWYNLLLWDNKTKTFVPSESFREICNPVVDAYDKVIRSRGSNSAFEDVYSIYRHKDDAFYLSKRLVSTRGEVNGRETRMYEVKIYDGSEGFSGTFESIEPPDPNHPDEEDFWGPNSTWKLDDPIWGEKK